AEHVPGLVRIADMKVRWMGHRLHADLAIEVDSALTVTEANRIAAAYERELFEHIAPLAAANVRFDTTGNQDPGVWPAHQHHHTAH
ncbi:MAG TPA: cation transporter dimerization domain-containing protein, partial [Devosiaceae bacterium]